MKQIILFGAGKSATILIEYLLEHASLEQWKLTVVDANLDLARAKLLNSPHGEAMSFDISLQEQRESLIAQGDLVISMLPPGLHQLVAATCLQFGKHLLTASYVDESMRAMAPAIKENGLLFLCEMGLDPGIDHMSAMKLINEIHQQDGRIISYLSHCGGLIAPESDNNPWHYKISWNPRNIVMAGSSGAEYKKDGLDLVRPYISLFENRHTVTVPGHQPFAWYANRDSLSYLPLYGLEETQTFIRTTLRHPDFMKAWNYIVKAGLTSEDFCQDYQGIPINEWVDRSVRKSSAYTDLLSMLDSIADDEEKTLVHQLFEWLGLLSTEPITVPANSSADILQSIVEKMFRLMPGDKDMIVMLHELEYMINDTLHAVKSSLVVTGTDSNRTAMATTVGLPLGIAARLILTGRIRLTGLHIPIHPEIYEPVLSELAINGIRFHEEAVIHP